MTAASHLQPTREYLLWWETHKDRWVAAPVVRSGAILTEVDYMAAVSVHLASDGGAADHHPAESAD